MRLNGLAIAIAGGVGAVLIAACGGDGGGSPTGGTLPPADSVLPAAVETFETLETFHFTLTHENGTSPIPNGLQLVSADGDVVAPDRMRAKIEAKVGDQTVRVEIIGVGDEGWMTNPFNRQWQPLPSGTTIKDIFDPAQGVKAIIGSLQNAQVTAEEKVGGAQTWHVEGTIQSDALAAAVPISRPGLTVGIEAWIETDSSLIRQVYLNGPIAPDEPENIVRKLTLSDFGEQITITPPPQ
ncbi:MAG TPA: LppX_LprAFG lipoprotein [Dehalococcoidia bacterium]|nr:LppX_LprAFG lipoprotein [Dehalococcoidia bacterium]